MEWKKFAFFDQFPCWKTSPARRKVVCGFGLGLLVASLFVLSVVSFYVSSFTTPLINPVLKGFNTFASHNHNYNSTTTSSFLSWPVYFSKTTASSSSPCNASSSCNGSVPNNNNLECPMVMNETQKSRRFFGFGGKGEILEARVGNSSEKVKNGNFSVEVEGGKVQDGSLVDKNENFSNEGNFSGNVGNQNVTAGEPNAKEETSHKKADSGELPKTCKEKKSSHMNDRRISSRENGGTKGTMNSRSFNRNCNIFDGRWVRSDEKPYYPPGSCPYVDLDFDCFLNKRPDDNFLKWKWQPYHCDIPSLNATDFLERLRGKKLSFVGDSLNRNMWESLVCILRHSVPDKNKVYEISGKTEFKKGGFYAFRFEDYNCTVDFVNSPFLVRESTFNGINGTFETLRLDLMDKTTSMYYDADVLVFNTAHWWTHEKTYKGEDYYQEGNRVHRRLKVLEAYRRALRTWARWVDRNIDKWRSQVIFRGYSLMHFSGGQWNSGGQCHKETEPISNETYLGKYPSKMKALEHVIHKMRTPVMYLNISRLTDFRKDGHPSIYRKEYKTLEERMAGELHQDCSHWCLPGVPDTWNELLYASLLKTGRGSWIN